MFETVLSETVFGPVPKSTRSNFQEALLEGLLTVNPIRALGFSEVCRHIGSFTLPRNRTEKRNSNVSAVSFSETGKESLARPLGRPFRSPKMPFFSLFSTLGRGSNQKTFRYLWRFYSLLFRGFSVAFPWLFRGPLRSRKTVFGRFSWLFRGFFVAFSWPSFWANFTRTRPGKVF